MKVYVGPYISRWTSRIDEVWLQWRYKKNYWNIDDNQYDRWDRLVIKLDDAVQWLYNATVNKYLDEKERKINIRVDRYDVWSMDYTLSVIVVPMLKEIQKNKNGAPFVNDEDVPESIRSTSAPPKETEYDIDDYHFDRWDWVLNEMLWAFEQKARDDWESDYYEYEHLTPDKNAKTLSEKMGVRLMWSDDEGREAHQARMTNGFRLFGKYFENLWT